MCSALHNSHCLLACLLFLNVSCQISSFECNYGDFWEHSNRLFSAVHFWVRKKKKKTDDQTTTQRGRKLHNQCPTLPVNIQKTHTQFFNVGLKMDVCGLRGTVVFASTIIKVKQI